MPASFGVVYPPWVHAQRGGELLDRVAGEVGAQHLTVPVISGPVRELRFDSGDAPHLFASEGGWHYPADRQRYPGHANRVRSAGWTGRKNWLEAVCEAARRMGLSVVFRVDLRAVAHLTVHEEHLLARNAWGEPDSLLGPCVSSPLLRDLLRETLEDLAAFEPDGFEIADWLPGQPAGGGRSPLDWHAELNRLYGVCFCPACREIGAAAGPLEAESRSDQVSGLDPDAVARSVQVQLSNWAAADPTSHPPRRDPPAERYSQALQQANADWLRRLALRHVPRAIHLLCNDGARREAGPWLADGVPPLVRLDSDAARLDAWLDNAENAQDALAMPCWRPAFSSGQELNRSVKRLADAGTSYFDFEDLHTAPAPAVEWLRQAVRYARRA